MKQLIDHLTRALGNELPGEKAHAELAPIQRPPVELAKNWDDTRITAVLVLIYPDGEDIYTSLMKRPEYGGVHSGQVSFPGGKMEEEDGDLETTALREAREELNIQPTEVTVIGKLSELYIPPSKSLVTPIIGYSEKKPQFIADKKEVGEIIEAELFRLIHPDSLSLTEIVRSSYLMSNVPAFIYDDHVIWGATAMIINELKWLLRDLDPHINR